jgi:hypothetical protein
MSCMRIINRIVMIERRISLESTSVFNETSRGVEALRVTRSERLRPSEAERGSTLNFLAFQPADLSQFRFTRSPFRES